MILYHVSTDIKKDGHFFPRQPKSIMEGEIISIDRICVAPTIADCLSAIPGGGSRLDELNEKQDGFYKVFRIDTEKIGIPDKQILTSDYLFKKGSVPDADCTNEHWITRSFSVSQEDIFMIHLSMWEEESCDVVPQHIYEIADKHYEGDFFEAYFDEMGENVPCMSVIRNTDYQQEPYKKGGTIPLISWDIEEEGIERLIYLAKSDFNVELERQGEMELIVREGELTVEQHWILLIGSVLCLKK